MSPFGRKVHFVGIGGSGMQGLADVLLARGSRVSGSDMCPTGATQRLVERGAQIFAFHDATHVSPDVDYVVYSAAVKPSNPEIVAATRLGIPRLKYAEMLGQLMRDQQGICIAGAHGKSTTSAMTGWSLCRAGLDPSVVVGAVVPQLGGSARGGTGKHFVAESCEYDRSFLNLTPQAAAILNIQEDHLDFYSGLEQIVESFRSFAHLVPPEGLIVACGECDNALRAVADAPAAVETFAIDRDADWRAVGLQDWQGRYGFDVVYRGRRFGRFSLRVPGRHNVLNALAAVALSHWAGAKPEVIETALASFRGVGRRFEIRGHWAGVTVVDDYAHHPTEVNATLRAARRHFGDRRIWVVFQPHQHSRTRFLLGDFARAFGGNGQDGPLRVLVPDIYFVRDSQKERERISSEDLVTEIAKRGGNARYLPTLEEIVAYLETQLQRGDVIMTMGAGDVWKVADALVGRLQGHHKAG